MEYGFKTQSIKGKLHKARKCMNSIFAVLRSSYKLNYDRFLFEEITWTLYSFVDIGIISDPKSLAVG